MWDSSILTYWSWQAFRKFSVWAETAQIQPSDSLIPHFLCTFLYLLFWSVLLPFRGSSPGLSYRLHLSLSVSVPQALFSALWISLSTPHLPLSPFFSDLIHSQNFHLYSVSPKSISLALTSQIPSLNIHISKMVVISASQANMSKSQHFTFSQTISSPSLPKLELMHWYSSSFLDLKPKSNLTHP